MVEGEILVVYDFDYSLVDADSDRYVFEVLAPKLRQRLEDLKGDYQWTDLMDNSLGLLHEGGASRADLEHALQLLPFHPAMQRGVRSLKKRRKVTFFCCSNSNSVFIDTILRHHQFGDVFAEIVTNPAKWEESGRLSVRRRTPPDGPQHGCQVGCSANMCKGTELQKFFASRGGIDQFETCIFVGDGANDLCGLLQFRERDIGFVRSGFELERRIDREGSQWGLKCGVKKWREAWNCEQLLDAL